MPRGFKSDVEFFKRTYQLLEAGTNFAIATVVSSKGSTPREPGARMIIFPDGKIEGTVGGGLLEKMVIEDAIKILEKSGNPRLITYRLTEKESGGIGAVCGGESEIFFEVPGQNTKILIAGGGHVGSALASVAVSSGFAVTIVENRPEILDSSNYPNGAEIVKINPGSPDVVGLVNSKTAAVILTHSHTLDLEVLRLLINTPAFYIGMIGSKRKVSMALDTLEKEGFPREKLEKIYAPVGIDIGAETPEEIAVSIVAEIIAVIKKGGVTPLSMKLERNREEKEK